MKQKLQKEFYDQHVPYIGTRVGTGMFCYD